MTKRTCRKCKKVADLTGWPIPNYYLCKQCDKTVIAQAEEELREMRMEITVARREGRL